jgi:hypothetical protein
MDRETNKHSPRVDEAMAHDVDSLVHGAPEESRAQEWRLQEDPAVTPRQPSDEPLPGVGISEAEADGRAELSRHLAAARFPARKDDLVVVARDDHAPEVVVLAIDQLPPDAEYENVQAVWQALGGKVEPPHTRPN